MTRPAIPPADPRDQATARFLAELGHELRTPLGAIIGFADAMSAEAFGPLSEIYAEHAALIGLAGRHLLDLTDDLTDMADVQTGRVKIAPEAFEAAPAIGEAVRLMSDQARDRGIELTAAMQNGPLMVMADRRRLTQIVFNLISNGLKFTPLGGAVSVTATARDGDLLLVVADNGVGIRAGDLAGLGEAYRQAGDAKQRALGVGLGLWMVRALSEAHGGTMQIESAPGAGTTVRVRLPVSI